MTKRNTKRTTTSASKQPPIIITSKDELTEALDRIARLGVEVDGLTAKLEEAQQAVLDEHSPAIAAAEDEIKRLTEAAELYAAPRKQELFGKGKKSAETALTVFGYRADPSSLATLRGWTFDKVIALLESRYRRAYVIYKPQLNKEAIRAHVRKANLAKIGLTLKQGEKFFVERKTSE